MTPELVSKKQSGWIGHCTILAILESKRRFGDLRVFGVDDPAAARSSVTPYRRFIFSSQHGSKQPLGRDVCAVTESTNSATDVDAHRHSGTGAGPPKSSPLFETHCVMKRKVRTMIFSTAYPLILAMATRREPPTWLPLSFHSLELSDEISL